VIKSLSQVTESTSVHKELVRHIGYIQQESNAGALIDADRERIAQLSTELTDLLKSKDF
jgi:protein-arginine kinase activator protein McsA